VRSLYLRLRDSWINVANRCELIGQIEQQTAAAPPRPVSGPRSEASGPEPT
jgi:hypothetical protein